MNQYYAYTRVSTARQARGTSLEAQQELITNYAKRHGLLITEWIHETRTAANHQRTGFRELVGKLQKRKADGLILHAIDRGARNLKDWALLGELTDSGIDVRFVQEGLDLQSRSGRLSADIQAVIAADYIRNLRDETKKGINFRLRQGLYPFPAPLGYVNNGARALKTPDSARAPFIKEAFRLYATGAMSSAALADHLYAEGLRNTRMRKVPAKAILSILQNSFYCGMIRVGTTNYPGLHEPLVREQLFDEVQAVFADRRQVRKHRHAYLFRKLLTCAVCEKKLIGEKQKGHVYYRCHTSGHNVCIREEDVEQQLSQYFRAKAREAGWIQRVDRIISQALPVTPKKEYLSAQRLRIHTLKQRRENLDRLYFDGLLTQAELETKRLEIDKQIQQIVSQQRVMARRIKKLEEEQTYLKQFFSGFVCSRRRQDVNRDALLALDITMTVTSTKQLVIQGSR